MALLFGAGCIYLALYFATSETINYKSIFKWIIQRAPEFRVFFDDITINILPLILFTFGLLLTESSLRIFFIKGYKDASWEVTKESVKVFNNMVGKEILIPLSSIFDIDEQNNFITLYLDEEHKSRVDIPIKYLSEPLEFKNLLLTNWEKIKASEKKYTVVFDNSSPNDKEVFLLSKLLKTSKSEVIDKASKGAIVLKSALDLDIAKKLLVKFGDYNLEVKVTEDRILKSNDNDTLNKKLTFFCFPYLTLLSITMLLPGGLFIWVYWIFNSLEKTKKNLKESTKASVLLVVALIEYSSTEGYEFSFTGAESMIYFSAYTIIAVLLGLILRAGFKDTKTSLFLSIMFPLIYFTYKTNSIIQEQFK